MKARHAVEPPAKPPAESARVLSVAHERSSLPARLVAWSVVPIYVAGICAFLWLERRLDVPDENPTEGIIIFVGVGAFAVVGALLVAKRPANPVGWIMAAVALMIGLFPTGDMYAAYVMTTRGRPDTLAVLGAWIQSWYWILLLALVFVYLPLLFPDGRLPSRRWLPVAVAPGVGVLSLIVLGMLTDTLSGQEMDYRIENPIGIEGLAPVEELPVFGVLSGLFGIGALGAVAAVVVRFRRSQGVKRQQMTWFLYAAAPLALFPIQDYLPGIVGSVAFGWMLIAVPTAIGISVLRYRLFDIDLVINRTLVYGVLTACVVGIYVFVVGYLGAMFRTSGNLPISLVAAGIVAVLFAPLRERLQRAVNRLMYGERDDPYAALSRLGQRLEETVAPGAVIPTAVRTVSEALKSPYVAVELRRNGAYEIVAATGEPVEDTLRLPLVYGGETIGRLALGLRHGEEDFSITDRRLLDDLARQIGVAVHASRLTEEALRLSADLQRSRERLVSAREEERRRLRRDLHDGLGPQLASLTMKAEAARDLLRPAPERSDALLEEIMVQAQEAVADVRRLVYGLRPPALDDLGLLGALKAQASHSDHNGLRVTVEAPDELPSLPAAVEVAAYRIAQEALTNAARHAEARNCEIRITPDEQANVLRLEITDDGRGLPEIRPTGVGLHSMRERAEELGGRWEVTPTPAGGTRVLARLPLAVTEASGENKDLKADA